VHPPVPACGSLPAAPELRRGCPSAWQHRLQPKRMSRSTHPHSGTTIQPSVSRGHPIRTAVFPFSSSACVARLPIHGESIHYLSTRWCRAVLLVLCPVFL
jgi:hypothetical protein